MKKNGQERSPDALELIRESKELLPNNWARVFSALNWLYKHPLYAKYLCGQPFPEEKAAEEFLLRLKEENRPEYLALFSYRRALMRKTKMQNEKTGGNPIKTQEKESK